jgi:membrane carboxypeptidase/penicillin-binding protein
MKKALEGQDPADFTAPAGVVFRQIDPRTGLLSTEKCRSSIAEAFLQGTEPKKYCEERDAAVMEEIPVQDESPE